jgi:hypothetical protein
MLKGGESEMNFITSERDIKVLFFLYSRSSFSYSSHSKGVKSPSLIS